MRAGLSQALRYLHRALELDPLSYNALVNLGVHFQNQGDLDQAKQLFRRALKAGAGAWWSVQARTMLCDTAVVVASLAG